MNHQICEDNPDALTHHEVLLPGHLLLKVLQERLEDGLGALKEAAAKALESNPEGTNLQVGWSWALGTAPWRCLFVCLGGGGGGGDKSGLWWWEGVCQALVCWEVGLGADVLYGCRAVLHCQLADCTRLEDASVLGFAASAERFRCSSSSGVATFASAAPPCSCCPLILTCYHGQCCVQDCCMGQSWASVLRWMQHKCTIAVHSKLPPCLPQPSWCDGVMVAHWYMAARPSHTPQDVAVVRKLADKMPDVGRKVSGSMALTGWTCMPGWAG